MLSAPVQELPPTSWEVRRVWCVPKLMPLVMLTGRGFRMALCQVEGAALARELEAILTHDRFPSASKSPSVPGSSHIIDASSVPVVG